MKKNVTLMLPLAVAIVIGCSGNGKGNTQTEADSIYSYNYIKRIHLSDPQRGLGLIDTAGRKCLMGSDSCNWLRGIIYYESMKDYSKAKDYCQKVLNNLQNDTMASLYLSNIKLMAAILLTEGHYNESLRYCLKGAALAHEAGKRSMEAEFDFQAGACMERANPGSGIVNMDRGIELFKSIGNNKLLPMLSYFYGQKMRYLANQGKYKEAIRTGKERLDAISSIERTADDNVLGFYERQKASTYSVMAYCLQKMGDTAEARQYAESFEQTEYAKNSDGKEDIMNYYALAGNAQRVLALCSEIEPSVKQDDSINKSYLSILQNKAMAYWQSRDYRMAYQALKKAATISDSIAARDKKAQALLLSQIYKTQEKDLMLKDREKENYIYLVCLFAALLIILFTIYHTWRLYRFNKALMEKNTLIYKQKLEMECEAAEKIEMLQSRPETDLSQNQRLFRNICQLMETERIYTDDRLNRDILARRLSTNSKYVEQAIRECTNGMTVSDFINRYRMSQVAKKLKTSDEAIGLIGEMCGIGSRSTLSRLFHDIYGMAPSEYRKISRENMAHRHETPPECG